MANTLGDTINFIIPFCRYMSANIGTSNQPIIGIANIVRNIILSAPMVWDFNRVENSSTTLTANTQDYTLSVSDFGYLERASVQDPVTSKWYEIPDVRNNSALAKSSTPVARPQVICVQNGTGPVFRFSAVPDQNYPLAFVYQKNSVQFTATTDQWAPIPDSYSDIYNNMCLGYYMDSCQDPRAPQYIQRGIASLLARQSGLSEMDKAIFAQMYMNFDAAQMAQSIGTQQGKQAQGAR